MVYEVPAAWTTDGVAIPQNNALSQTDITSIGRWYPQPLQPSNATGLLRTGDDCDEIDFRVDYSAIDPTQVEFVLQPAGSVRWWKAIEVPRGASYQMFQMQDGRSAGGSIPRQEINQSEPIRFWKAKAFGVHTRLGFTWDVLQAVPGGCRVTLTWRRDHC